MVNSSDEKDKRMPSELSDLVGRSNKVVLEILGQREYRKWTQEYYPARFLQLLSAPDILRATMPLGNKAMKEVTESMAVIKRLKKYVLPEPGKYRLYDLCAGNALTGVIAAHLLPFAETIAIDYRKRERDWGRVRRFSYRNEDILEMDPDSIPENSILIGVHPCGELSSKIIDLYQESKADHLVIMPCCNGEIDKLNRFLVEQMGPYLAWSYQLAQHAQGQIEIDESVLSPKNAIITASKRKFSSF